MKEGVGRQSVFLRLTRGLSTHVIVYCWLAPDTERDGVRVRMKTLVIPRLSASCPVSQSHRLGIIQKLSGLSNNREYNQDNTAWLCKEPFLDEGRGRRNILGNEK